MKNKNNHSIHQRVEHFFRKPLCLYGVLGFVALGVSRADGRMLSSLHQAYVQGFGTLGIYLREEPTRLPVNFGTNIRIVNTSSE